MQFLRNKTTAISIVIFLIITVGASMILLPTATAHTPAWKLPTHAYIAVTPNPVGVGQQTLIVVWLDRIIQGALIDNNIRYENYKVTIAKPDGTTETRTWPIVTDTTSSAFTQYTPDQVGTYNFFFEFPGQTYNFGGAYQGDMYLPSNASTSITVQQDPIPALPATPLPSEYWARPINGQNILWGSISSNWLGGAPTADVWQEDAVAPKSSHIMWTKPLEFGGFAGGTADPGATFYTGFSYETRFNNPIILGGVLYYQRPLNHAGGGGGTVAVDIRTGQQIWARDDIAVSKGQLFNFDNPNQHGVVGGILWQVSGTTWNAIDAFSGKSIFNLTNVPSGTEVVSDHGEILRYVLSYNTTARSGTLSLWNYTAAPTLPASLSNPWRPVGKTIDTSRAYSWANMSVPALTGSQNPVIIGAIYGDLLFGRSSDVALTSLPRETPDPYTLWAINLNASRGPIGSLLWIRNYNAPANNITRMLAWQPIDPVYRTFTMTDFETGQRYGFSLNTGEQLWGPVGEFRAFQYYSSRKGFTAYGNLYVSGYGGEIQAFDMRNGNLIWKFNDTNSGIQTSWGQYPIQASAAADGMIIAFAGEHSPNTPLYRGYRVWAVDAFTGKEVWNLTTWSASGLGTSLAPVAIADGYMTFHNAYDGRIYSVGKGPSQITVTAPNTASLLGTTVTIKGTVMDIAAGTKQDEQAARFPNGVPAVSDESQTAWMEYIYMQQQLPTNVVGVPITISVVDANGNYRDIGTTTSNADGFFAFNWKPDIEGQFTVYASFTGSKSYYPSHAVTAFNIEPAAATPTPATPPNFDSVTQSLTMIVILAAVAIIIAIAIVGFLVLRKHP
jgi:outer membrane protein assembly factor BamB